MDYCCDDCSFLFRRGGEIHICPSCEGLNLRAATKTERDQLEKPMSEVGEILNYCHESLDSITFTDQTSLDDLIASLAEIEAWAAELKTALGI